MALAGNLNTLPLPDVFQTLTNIKATGVLRLVSPAGSRDVVFQQGEILGVGFLDPEQDQSVESRLKMLGSTATPARGKRSDTWFLKAMAARSRARQEEHDEIVRQQAMEQLHNLFAWNTAEFSFATSTKPDDDAGKLLAWCRDKPIRMNTAMVLMDAARQQDEWADLRARIRAEAGLAPADPAAAVPDAIDPVAADDSIFGQVPGLAGTETVATKFWTTPIERQVDAAPSAEAAPTPAAGAAAVTTGSSSVRRRAIKADPTEHAATAVHDPAAAEPPAADRHYHIYLDNAWQGPYLLAQIEAFETAGTIDGETWTYEPVSQVRIQLGQLRGPVSALPASDHRMRAALAEIRGLYDAIAAAQAPVDAVGRLHGAHSEVRAVLAASADDREAVTRLVAIIGDAGSDLANHHHDPALSTRIIRLIQRLNEGAASRGLVRTADRIVKRIVADAIDLTGTHDIAVGSDDIFDLAGELELTLGNGDLARLRRDAEEAQTALRVADRNLEDAIRSREADRAELRSIAAEILRLARELPVEQVDPQLSSTISRLSEVLNSDDSSIIVLVAETVLLGVVGSLRNGGGLAELEASLAAVTAAKAASDRALEEAKAAAQASAAAAAQQQADAEAEIGRLLSELETLRSTRVEANEAHADEVADLESRLERERARANELQSRFEEATATVSELQERMDDARQGTRRIVRTPREVVRTGDDAPTDRIEQSGRFERPANRPRADGVHLVEIDRLRQELAEAAARHAAELEAVRAVIAVRSEGEPSPVMAGGDEAMQREIADLRLRLAAIGGDHEREASGSRQAAARAHQRAQEAENRLRDAENRAREAEEQAKAGAVRLREAEVQAQADRIEHERLLAESQRGLQELPRLKAELDEARTGRAHAIEEGRRLLAEVEAARRAATPMGEERLRAELGMLREQLTYEQGRVRDLESQLAAATRQLGAAEARGEASRDDALSARSQVLDAIKAQEALRQEIDSLKKEIAAAPPDVRQVRRLQRRLDRAVSRLRELRRGRSGSREALERTSGPGITAAGSASGTKVPTSSWPKAASALNRGSNTGAPEPMGVSGPHPVVNTSAAADPLDALQPGSITGTFLPGTVTPPTGNVSERQGPRLLPMSGQVGAVRGFTSMYGRPSLTPAALPSLAATGATTSANQPSSGRRHRGLVLPRVHAAYLAIGVTTVMAAALLMSAPSMVPRGGAVVTAELIPVTAPIDGVVSGFAHRTGDEILAGTTLAQIVNDHVDDVTLRVLITRRDDLRTSLAALSDERLAIDKRRPALESTPLQARPAVDGAMPANSHAERLDLDKERTIAWMSELDHLNTQVQDLQGKLAIAEKAVDEEQIRLARQRSATLAAPRNAVIINRAGEGQAVSAGAMVAELADPATIVLVAYLPSKWSSQVAIGDRVRVDLGDGRQVDGAVKGIGPRPAGAAKLIDDQDQAPSGSLRVTVSLLHPDPSAVRQGARVAILGTNPGIIRRLANWLVTLM